MFIRLRLGFSTSGIRGLKDLVTNKKWSGNLETFIEETGTGILGPDGSNPDDVRRLATDAWQQSERPPSLPPEEGT